MMKIKNVQVYGLNESLVRSGYPQRYKEPRDFFDIGIEKFMQRGRLLGKVRTGTGHDNFLKGIIVQFDLKYPEYFSPQLQRYSYIDIVSSQSKMYTLTKRELTKNDFTESTSIGNIDRLNNVIKRYNSAVNESEKNKYFNHIISNLPSGYLKWMGISTNYLQLKTIRQQRRTHKLQEWKDFCKWIDSLPHFQELTNKNYKNENM